MAKRGHFESIQTLDAIACARIYQTDGCEDSIRLNNSDLPRQMRWRREHAFCDKKAEISWGSPLNLHYRIAWGNIFNTVELLRFSILHIASRKRSPRRILSSFSLLLRESNAPKITRWLTHIHISHFNERQLEFLRRNECVNHQ